MPLSSLRIFLGIAGLFLAVAGRAWADTAPGAFTMDLPFPASTATPVWLGQPVTPATSFATLNLPIQPVDATSFLLVTVYFQEQPAGFLRVMWQGAGGDNAQTLSDNFYEGVGMGNQRSLLISPETMQGGGTLVFQSGATSLGIARIRMQWLVSQDGLVAPEISDTLVTPSPGPTQPAQVLNGQPAIADLAAWHGHLVDVPITDTPQRIEQGVEFSVQLDAVPLAGRLVLAENGLPWGKHLVVWINRQRAGTITPSVPDLLDDGYLSPDGVYTGWREGSIHLPSPAFVVGPNTIQFSLEDDVSAAASADPNADSSSATPLAIKDVVLQMHYPAETIAAPAALPAAPVPASTPATSSPPPDDDSIDTPGASALPPSASTPTGPLP
jgi:hypothetical protein